MLMKLAVMAGASGLAGCATDAKSTLGRSTDRLRILNWTSYIDTGADSTVPRFQNESGIPTTYDEGFNANNEIFDKVLAPALGSGKRVPFDIVCPTFWLAARLIDRGWVEPLPLEDIPNHVNLDVSFLRQPFDRGALYNLPWQSGITGIAYNTNLVKEVRTVAELLSRPDLKGRVAFFAEMRDSLGLTMLSAGVDPSDGTVQQAQAALEVLRSAKSDGQILEFADNEGYLEGLKSNRFAACVAWSGDLVQLQRERPEFAFVIPDEGGMQWFDTMVIPKRTDYGAAAARWMNFVYDPLNAARISASVQYISPVIGVRDALVTMGGDAARLADNPLMFPDQQTQRRLSTWSGPTSAEEDDLAVSFLKLSSGA